MDRERAPQLDDDPERPVRLSPEAHRAHHPGWRWGMHTVHPLGVGEIDDDAVRVIEGEDALLRAVREIEGQLRRIRGGGEPDAAQLHRECRGESHHADQSGGESPAKNLLYHELRSLSCFLIYGVGGAFSTWR